MDYEYLMTIGQDSHAFLEGEFDPSDNSIMLGGVIRFVTDKIKAKKGEKAEGDSGSGILFSSGLIAGEGLVGILLAILAVAGVDSKIDISSKFNTGTIGGLILLVFMCARIWFVANPSSKAPAKKKSKK